MPALQLRSYQCHKTDQRKYFGNFAIKMMSLSPHSIIILTELSFTFEKWPTKKIQSIDFCVSSSVWKFSKNTFSQNGCPIKYIYRGRRHASSIKRTRRQCTGILANSYRESLKRGIQRGKLKKKPTKLDLQSCSWRLSKGSDDGKNTRQIHRIKNGDECSSTPNFNKP